MFRITVNDASIETLSGVSRRTGQPYAMHKQKVVVDLPNGERRVIELQHEQATDAPLPVGEYKPKETAGYVGRYGSLEVSTRARHWEPVNGSAKSAQAPK